MGFGKKGFAMDGIKGTFDLYGMGDGNQLFSDFEPAKGTTNAFAKAADPTARTGEYWKPAESEPAPAVLENFREMVLGNGS